MNRCFIAAHYLAARRRFTAFADRRALESWQAARVQRHLQSVSERSPFYREWFAKPMRGSPTLLSSWPRVDKRTMTANLDRWLTRPVDLDAAKTMTTHAAENRDFTGELPGNVTVGLSSGTTGPAAMFFVSARERAAWAGLALARVAHKLSARHPQRVAFFLRANSPLYESVGSRALRFAYFDLQRPFARLVDELQSLMPTMIVAPPGILRGLAAECIAGRLRVSPARVVAVAEVFDADDRAAVEVAFGVRAGEVYQASEGFLAATCPAGALHWNEDVVHVEREELDGGRYHPVLTDFRRTLQPIVRYRLDDVLTDEPEDTPPCACGSVFRRIRRIEGRSDDGLRLPRADGLGGGVLFPDFVRLAVARAAGDVMEDFRVRQVDSAIVEVSLRPALSEESQAAFLARLADFLKGRLCASGTIRTDVPLGGLARGNERRSQTTAGHWPAQCFMSKPSLSIMRRGARMLLHVLLIWWVVERTVRWALVQRFFRREKGRQATTTRRTPLTLVQPILSGDPFLGDTLRANATLEASITVRWKWLVDENDLAGRQITDALLAELAAASPLARQRVERILSPPAPAGVNPKTYKLRLAWEHRAPDEADESFGVLDDDTRLLPGQLERAAASLENDPRVGLVFGLPYYRSFDTSWSALVSTFVNRNSLWSYVPILSVMPPPTINGMFWLARPEAVEALDGFRAVEGFVCDDHAVARGVRAAGYELRQTAVVHPLRTGVADARAYDRLITRWFIFPQVSLLRHEPTRNVAGFCALVFLPTFQFFAALVLAALAGGWRAFAWVLAAQGWREALQAQLELHHLPGAAGHGREFWRRRALGWLVDLLMPLQVVRALFSPRVIEWRGHRLRLDTDGRFEYLLRRGDP